MVRRRVLFLCTGNSCRSQMAEAIVNARMPDTWEAQSAGTAPTGVIHPLALDVLREIGIEHRGRSKSIDEYRGAALDLVVTVCDASAENCPVWLGASRRAHLSFTDPGRATGTHDELVAAFRAVRDAIAEQVPDLLRRSAEDRP